MDSNANVIEAFQSGSRRRYRSIVFSKHVIQKVVVSHIVVACGDVMLVQFQ